MKELSQHRFNILMIKERPCMENLEIVFSLTKFKFVDKLKNVDLNVGRNKC